MNTNIGQQKDLIKDTEMSYIKDIRNKSLQVFENKEYFKIAITKAERLASALYLVSNLIDDGEPIKWMIRKVGIEIISDIGSIESGKGDKGHKISIVKISAKIFEMSSLLQVSWMGGLISRMNFEILKTEYFTLEEFLKNKFYSTHSENILVSRDFFETGQLREMEHKANKLSVDTTESEDRYFADKKNNDELLKNISAPKQEQISGNTKVVIKDTKKDMANKGQVRDSGQYNSTGVVKDGLLGADKIIKDTNSENISTPDKNKKKRHDLILSLMKPGSSYTVPEIIALIGMGADLSEKTIQRDLIYLIVKKVLKKTGERRWSRYSLSTTESL
ncbi:MAG: hypothetical protein WCO84_04095 [bacterium]